MYKKLIIGLILLIMSSPLFSQDIEVKGYFLDDSIKIGIGSPYVLTAKYSRGLDVIFPDSLFSYAPFELGEKRFTTTRSTLEYSYDSAIYYLLSFEIDSTQFFSLPVFQLVAGDSISIQSQQDSIFLTHMVAEIPDSVAAEAMPLVENTTYRYVSLALNYPYLITGGIVLIVLLVIAYAAFGKSIKKWFKLRTLNKKHEQFILKYNTSKENAKDVTTVEQLIYLWKKYLEQLEKQPYTKMTTKELLRIEPFDRIEELLKRLDRTIYDKFEAIENELYDDILTHTQNRFEDKVNEVKHG